MRFWLTSLLLCLVFHPAAAQQAGAERASIEGQVVRAGTGEPLRKARVILRKAEGRDQGQIVLTDASGGFSFAGLEPGTYRLSAERNGYLRQDYGQRVAGRSIAQLSLRPGERLHDVVFRMIPWAIIAGRITDQDGEPLLGVRVQAMRFTYARGRRQLTPAAGASTNDLGEFRVYGLSPGRYYLSATHMEYMRAQSVQAAAGPTGEVPADEGYAPMYYPGVLDPNQAVPVEVQAGAELLGYDMRLIETRMVRIRGKVTNSSGGLVRGTVLTLVAREGGGASIMPAPPATVRGADGEFEIRRVLPGSYFLTANLYTQNRRYGARQRIDVGLSGLDGVQVNLSPGVNLTGRVQIENGAELNSSGFTVFLQPVETGIPVATRLNADGTFSLNNLFPDTYSIAVSGPASDLYLKSARLGNVDVLESGLSVGPDTAGTLELTMSPNGASVEGSVITENDQPLAGAAVVLAPVSRRAGEVSGRFPVTATDQFGMFAISGLAPAEYRAFAWEDVEPGALEDPEFLKQHEDRSITVRVQEGDRRNVQLRAIPAGGDFQ